MVRSTVKRTKKTISLKSNFLITDLEYSGGALAERVENQGGQIVILK
jgi:hypothetical protein